jgi:hypothetical protein
MSFQTIPNTSTDYGLIAFDDDGRERTDDVAGGTFSRTLLERIERDEPTNIFLFSHGWKGDAVAAIDQYNRWIKAMVDLKSDVARMGPRFKPMWIGLHWPSRPWGEESSGAFDVAAGASIDALIAETAAHFGGGDEVTAAVRDIFTAFNNDPGASDVPPAASAAYKRLADAIGFAAKGDASGAPDEDGEPLDPQAALDADTMATQSFGVVGTIGGGILSGLRQLSFWTMKKRARTVGEGGMHTFIDSVQRRSSAKIHLMGHSFGCIVVSGIVNGPKGAGGLSRPINSLSLIQGALSLWSYADKVQGSSSPGYFQKVLVRQPAGVSGPIITTRSTHDTAVGVLYPTAVGLVREADFANTLPKYGAIGAFGIQGRTGVVDRPMLDVTGEYNFQPGTITNLEASTFIARGGGASGAHSDIDGPQVAHAMWQAALVS